MAVNTQSQSACRGRPPCAHLVADGKEVGVRSVFLSDGFPVSQGEGPSGGQIAGRDSRLGSQPPTRSVPAATRPCRGRSGARPPQMGAIRRPPALGGSFRRWGGGCRRRLSSSLHFLSGHLASLTVISLLFFLQRLFPTCANMCKCPQACVRAHGPHGLAR